MSEWSWSCPCGEQVSQETCSGCGRWSCIGCGRVVPPKTGCPSCHRGKVHEALLGRTSRFTVFRTGVQAVHLETPDGERSFSWSKGQAEPAPEESFRYAPSQKITWTLRGEDFCGGALELRCDCHPEQGPWWRLELSANELAKGECEWDGCVEDAQGDAFPDGKLTSEHSPYMLQLEGRRENDRRAYPPHAYTRFVGGTWLELVLEDKDTGRRMAEEPYEVTLSDGETVVEGQLDAEGFARLEGLDPGTCRVRFPNLDGDAWERKVSFIEVELRDEGGRPVGGERYTITLPDGSEQEGTLSPKGLTRLEGISAAGLCQVSFPDLDGEAWSRQEGARPER